MLPILLKSVFLLLSQRQGRESSQKSASVKLRQNAAIFVQKAKYIAPSSPVNDTLTDSVRPAKNCLNRDYTD